ncbi:MAG: hypothetical protein Q8Q17_01965 [bacterium]|nr:hypothetical protein [bacterium]
MAFEMEENKLETKRQIITEMVSTLKEALAKLEEKIGPVTSNDIFGKSSGILTRKEADHLYVTALADREDEVDSLQRIMDHAAVNPDITNDSVLEMDRQHLEGARALLAKLSS